ncbi:hypothetical protein J6590_066050 [Homalodisca vitripennis]|nr:hypothetical protein J6590_066050 [Homalodisca vitripennis]
MLVPIRGIFLMSLLMRLETRDSLLSVSKLAYETRDERLLVVCIEGQRRLRSSTGFNACPDTWNISYELAYETRDDRLLVVCIEGQRRVSITSGAAQGPMVVPIRGIFLMSLLMKLETRDSLLSVSKVSGVSGAAQGSMLVPIREIFLMSLLMRLETRDS